MTGWESIQSKTASTVKVKYRTADQLHASELHPLPPLLAVYIYKAMDAAEAALTVFNTLWPTAATRSASIFSLVAQEPVGFAD